MEYFSHDYSSREDEKIKNMMFKHGWNGYGIFWGLVESLYQNGGYMQTHYERISFDMRVDLSILKSIINDFDLFIINENEFYSKSILHRLKLRKLKSKSASDAAKVRWNKRKQNNANAMQTHSEGNAIKEKKKSKENKEINITFIDFWNDYNKKVGDKNSCEKKWNNLKNSEREKIINILPSWKKQFSDKQFQPYPATFLNQKRWNDEIKVNETLQLK